MPWWIVLSVATVAWFAHIMLEPSRIAYEDATNNVPEDKQRSRSVSIAPTIPFMPIMACVFANQFDEFVNPWSSTIVVWGHVALLIYSVAMHAWYGYKLHTMKSDSRFHSSG